MKRKAKVEFYKDESGEHRWRLKSSNGQVICTPGEGFKRKASAEGNFDKVAAALKLGKVVRVTVTVKEARA